MGGRSSVELAEAVVQLALSYEGISCLKVGDVEVYLAPNSNVGQLMEGVYPEAPSYDELTSDYVDSTEGPEPDER